LEERWPFPIGEAAEAVPADDERVTDLFGVNVEHATG
jgi:hypothetical protein